MKCFLYLLVALHSVVLTVQAQQAPPDTTAIPEVVAPLYDRGEGPVICVDAAHHNLHTVEGGFSSFAFFLERDGYRILSVDSGFEEKIPESCHILVIANALHESNLGNWVLPTPSAFTTLEVQVLEDWVSRGGSLFLIADHMPYPGAAMELGAAFGFTFNNGFAMKQVQTWPPAVFTQERGTIEITPVTSDIDSVATYTGQAFQIPAEAVSVLTFGNDHYTLMPDTAWRFSPDTPRESVEGWSQGALLDYGRGRLAVFGEAAMFTAQVAGTRQQHVGFTDPAAPQNARFLRNIIHWLDANE